MGTTGVNPFITGEGSINAMHSGDACEMSKELCRATDSTEATTISYLSVVCGASPVIFVYLVTALEVLVQNGDMHIKEIEAVQLW